MNLLHISKSWFDNSSFFLTAPDANKNKLVEWGLEDGYIKRTCFSNTIDKCLTALGKPIPEGSIFHVYYPSHFQSDAVVSNKVLLENKLVVDAKITGECWLTGEAKARHLCSIMVTGDQTETSFSIDIPGAFFNNTFGCINHSWRFLSDTDAERYSLYFPKNSKKFL